MKLIMLGTGHAMVTECYNTCFLMEDDGRLLLVDGGGGSGLLRQVSHAGYDCKDIHHIFVTHKHLDHLLGVVWMLRIICQSMARGMYEGEAYIYSHHEVLALLRSMAVGLLDEKSAACIDHGLHFVEVKDGETLDIIGHPVTFFDIRSTKAKQFGFCMELGSGKKLTCCGDEPLSAVLEHYAAGCEWLLHEAFCLHAEADVYKPYAKHHSTVMDACQLAERLGVRNLLLYHTEDQNLLRRRELYVNEGSQYFHGTLFVPDDLDVIQL